MFDLGPAARDLSRLVAGVSDDHLGRATPCAEWTVADLLAHIHQFSAVFTDNASKQPIDPPDGLPAEWRRVIPEQLAGLAEAWRDESAWQGRVSAGGVEMSGADNAVVAIEEMTVHAWDLARATDQQVSVDDARLDEVDTFFTLFGEADGGEGPFGSHVAAPEGADRWQQTLARTGRDPHWTPA